MNRTVSKMVVNYKFTRPKTPPRHCGHQ